MVSAVGILLIPVLIPNEPTGNLDSRTSKAVLQLFKGLAASGNAAASAKIDAISGYKRWKNKLIIKEDK